MTTKKNVAENSAEKIESAAGDAGKCCRTSECGGCTGFRIWTAVFVVVIAQVVSTAYFSGWSLEKMKDFQYEQRGGKETFELLNKAQMLQIQGQLDQIKAYVSEAEKAGTGSKATESTTTPAAPKTMTKEEVESIKKSAYFVGDANARIMAVEYTDPECPFCIRQSKDGVLSALLEKFSGKVKIAHKPFKAVPHPGADPKSFAMLCAGKLGGSEAYNAYYQGIMSRSTQSEPMPVADIIPLAKELKLDVKAFTACYDNKETSGEYAAATSEGQKYGVQGTPGTVIVDTETGNYQLIAGAYPLESFVSAVESLLK